MHRFTPDGRWMAPAGQFAARISAGQLPGALSKSLLVDFGVRAVLIENGEIRGELRPGTHILDSLGARLSLEPRPEIAVVVVRPEEIPVEIGGLNVRSQDDQAVCAGLRARVQIEDAVLFLENLFGAREYLALGELQSMLTPVLAQQLRESVGRMTLEELMRADGHRRLADLVGEAGEPLHYYGFRLGPLLEITVGQQGTTGGPAGASGAACGPIPSVPSVQPKMGEPPGATEPRDVLTVAGDLKKSGRRTIRLTETPAARSAPPLSDAPLAASLVNSLGMRLALVEPGSYLMGSPPDEAGRSGGEEQHLVEISRPFHLGVFPITQDEYRGIMGTDPSCFAQPESAADGSALRGRLPLERVSWDEACEFCRRLTELAAEQAAGRLYRLPTEAEWEYACRAGSTSAYSVGPSLGPAQANFDVRPSVAGSPGAVGSTTPVGSYPANAWGLCDMHGNVWEWCGDWFAADCYRRSPRVDPRGPESGCARVLRGGSWRSRAAQCRSAARYSATPTHRSDAFGFRVACQSG